MDRQRIAKEGSRLDREVKEAMSKGADPKAWLASYKLKQLFDLKRHVIKFARSEAKTKQDLIELLVAEVYSPELVNVRLEVFWGKKWDKHYYKETPGEGVYFNVMETHPYGAGFTGCPLGRSHVSAEEAIDDFLMYGKPEYKGKKPLTRSMVIIKEVKDFRGPIDGIAMPPKYTLPPNCKIIYTASGWEVWNHTQLLVAAVDTVRIAISDLYANYREQLPESELVTT